MRNFGTDSILTDQQIIVGYLVDAEPEVLDTFYVPSTLYRDKYYDYTISKTSVDMSTVKRYNFSVFTAMDSDTVETNDTLITYVDVHGYPTVDIGSDTLLEALTYTLDAGGGFSTYLWDNGESGQTRIVNNIGTYHVTVTDVNNCPAYDTAYVHLRIRDVRPDSLLQPVSDCEIIGDVNIQLRVLNNGTDTISTSEKIYVKYDLNNGGFISDSITLGADLYPGQTTNHTFTEDESFSNSGDYELYLLATTSKELKLNNDTLIDTVSIYPRPVVDFGMDDVEVLQEYDTLLDAGYGQYYTYLWQNATTEQTFLASESGVDYWVVVTDTRTSCTGSDTVQIYFIITDLGVISSNLPDSICPGSSNNVTVVVRNNGNNTISAGESVNIVGKLDGTEVINENHTIATALFGSQTTSVPLTTSWSSSAADSSVMKLYTVFSGDMDNSNDTLSETIGIKTSPEIDLGEVNDTVNTTLPHVLDAGAGNQSYSWSTGATSQTLNVTIPGTYSVTVTGTNGCSSSKTVYVSTGVFIRDFNREELDVTVYPNPATEKLFIEIGSGINEELLVELYSQEGNVIRQSSIKPYESFNSHIEVRDLPSGVYFLRIFNNSRIHVSKIIVR